MKLGYRIAAPIAYYNYRQDKVANFNWAQNAWDAVKGAGTYIDDAAQGAGRYAGQGIQNAGMGLQDTGRNLSRDLVRARAGTYPIENVNMLAAGTGSNLEAAGNAVRGYGNQLSNGGRYAKWARRAIGYGGAGLGALGVGAAGYAGYNALTGNN